MLIELKKRTFVEKRDSEFNFLIMMLYNLIKTVKIIKTSLN